MNCIFYLLHKKKYFCQLFLICFLYYLGSITFALNIYQDLSNTIFNGIIEINKFDQKQFDSDLLL